MGTEGRGSLQTTQAIGQMLILIIWTGTSWRGGQVKGEGNEFWSCDVVWSTCTTSKPRCPATAEWVSLKPRREVKVRDPDLEVISWWAWMISYLGRMLEPRDAVEDWHLKRVGKGREEKGKLRRSRGRIGAQRGENEQKNKKIKRGFSR